ncbi:MAG TPA: glycosyltransferase [Solirubrobacterales bacterium]|nr:glycosyltransferase [Solirubrobacterales bacterium]
MAAPAPQGSTAAPPVSVVICAYTLERIDRIAAAIESLAAQTVAPHEIVLVIDHSPELEAECRRRWPQVNVLPNREQQGLSGARNTGLEEASGEVVAFLDDDAVAAPDWIERLGAAYAEERVLGAGGTVRPDWSEGRPPWFPPEFDWVVGCTHSGMPRQREAVRNLVGANMSFRREALVESGGFRHELGRIGKIPAGCEETDLCIRIGQRHPDGEIVYDPEAVVDHYVPAERGSREYFSSRCRGEGRSKAILTALVGSDSGLSAERSYVRRTLPSGFLRGLAAPFRGDLSGPRRAAAIVFGLGSTTAGYLGARREARKIAKRRERLAASESGDGRLRVLMVTPLSPLHQGGVERHVMETSRRMAAERAEVEVLCTEPGGPPVSEEVRDGVRIRTVRSWPANRDWCFAPRLWREMSRRPWDVVHVQSYHTLVAPLAMLRALRLGIPYVVTFHGGGHSSGHRNSARGAQRRLLRPLLRRAARLVAVARFEVEEYGEELGLGPDSFALIPNGTDLAFSAAAPAASRNGSAAIASVGRLERYKGHHRVIEALPELLRLRPEATLAVVGTGPYEPELRQLADELGVAEQVRFTSTPPDQPGAMAELLGGISVVVLMSEFETHPLVALEAAAAGCRLVVADASGLAEIAADGFARAVPLDAAPAEVAGAVAAELDEPPQTKRPNLSSWDECAASLLELYRSLD